MAGQTKGALEKRVRELEADLKARTEERDGLVVMNDGFGQMLDVLQQRFTDSAASLRVRANDPERTAADRDRDRIRARVWDKAAAAIAELADEPEAHPEG